MAKEVQSADALKERALKEEERLAEIVRESNIVFIGTVTELGAPPKFWSGRFPSFQKVTYQVEEVLKGNKVSQITVAHIVVAKSKTGRSDEPGLSPALFQKGNRLIVIVVEREGELRSMDEDLGAVAYSEEALKKIKKVLPK